MKRPLVICLAVALGGISCTRRPKELSSGRQCSTIFSGEVTLCQGYLYSAYGLATGTSGPVTLRGEDPLTYDVYYLTAFGPSVKGTTCFRAHGGAWSYMTSRSQNLMRQVNGGEEFAERLLKGVTGPDGTTVRCAAVYDLLYPLTGMMTLSAPVSAGATTLHVTNIGSGAWFWPTSADPNYSVVLDQGKANQETVTVKAQSTGKARPTGDRTLTLSAGTAYAHTSVTVWIGAEGRENPGVGGNPGGPYAITFTGGGCTTEPTGTYAIASTGTLTMGGINVTSNGSGCRSSPTAGFPTGGWSKAPSAFVNFSTVNIATTEWPVQSNAVASFLSYHAHCSAGGTSPGAGTCAGGAVRGNPVPGSPNDDRCIGDSAGAHLCIMAALSGATYLTNTSGTPGYSEWTDTNWKVTDAAVWSLPADLNDMWQDDISRSGAWAVAGLIGGYPPNTTSLTAASPQHYASNRAPRMAVVNGNNDKLTYPASVSRFCASVPGMTCLIVSGQGHELDTWRYPGVTLGNILTFILPFPDATSTGAAR